MSDNKGLRAEAAELQDAFNATASELDVKGLRAEAAELRDAFNAMGEELDNHVKNINISRVVGGAAGVAGAITAIVGFALIPFTFGSSAVVGAVVGSVIAGAGGATAGGASITKLIIEKLKLKQVQTKWDDFCKRLQAELKEQYPQIHQKLSDQARDLMPSGKAVANATAATVGMATTTAAAAATADMTRVAAATGPKVAARLAAISARGSIILNAVLVGVSLYDIIDGSIELYKGRGSKVGDYCRMLAQSLDEIARNGLTEEYLLKASEMY